MNIRRVWSVLVISTQLAAHIQEATECIKTFLTQYSRPVTLLEFGIESRYIAELSKNRTAVGVMYSTRSSEGPAIAQKLANTGLSNVVVLNSRFFGVHELEVLTRCEHFDVSIVDQETFKGLNFMTVLPHLLRLGDYLLCIVDEESVPVIQNAANEQEPIIAVTVQDIQNSTKKLCVCATLKKGLDIARWNMYGIPSSGYTRYAVCSNFSSKTLRKGSTHTPWIPGINMITFIGCRGLLPTDTNIITMIGALKKIEHNDLVLGNMIVQGNKLAVIDFNDVRRNIRQRKCIRVAQSFFKSGIRFQKSPEDALHDYKIDMRG